VPRRVGKGAPDRHEEQIPTGSASQTGTDLENFGDPMRSWPLFELLIVAETARIVPEGVIVVV